MALIPVAPSSWAEASGKEADAVPFESTDTSKLAGDDREKWISEMRLKLPIASRRIGPFGMRQNPHVETQSAVQKAKPKPGAFLNAIAAIKINAVLPREKKFVIGSREVFVGDAFPVIRGGRQFNIKIVSVKSDHIVIKNVDTGQSVKRNLYTLPPGMTRNASINSVPGVVPADQKDRTPLNLDDGKILPTSNN